MKKEKIERNYKELLLNELERKEPVTHYAKVKGRTDKGMTLSLKGTEVYIPAEHLLDDLKNTNDKLLKNIHVTFKVMSYMEQEDKFYGTTILTEFYEVAKATNQVLEGTVVDYKTNGDLKYCMIRCLGDDMVMMLSEYSYMGNKETLEFLVGKRIRFVVDSVKEGTVYVSRKKMMEIERDRLIERLQTGEVIEAKIVSTESWGAKMMYEGHALILRNKDFSTDFTKIERVYKKDDVLRVKLTEISAGKRIFVEPEVKYTSKDEFDFNNIARDDYVVGDIVTIATMGLFVNIHDGVDVLCPIPDGMAMIEPSVGDSVLVKITKVVPERRRVRGKIVKVLPVETVVETVATDKEETVKDGE